MSSTRAWIGLLRRSVDGSAVMEGPMRSPTAGYGEARVLVVDDDEPVGWIHFEPQAVTDLLDACMALAPPLSAPRLPAEGRESISVAIPTHERPVHLERALGALAAALEGEDDVEVVVVDNAPQSDSTRDVVRGWHERGLRVRREVEDKPGTSRARNLALRVTDTELVAFIDDDVIVDRHWLRGLRRGFAGGATVVTGLVAPAELETEAQLMFERKMRWSEIRRRETFAMERRDGYDFPFPYMAGNFGSAANMAVRRRRAARLGGFDELLGPGTRTKGGEDFEFFVRVLRTGDELAFEPSAIAWHVHRRELVELRSQLFGYGVGMTGYLVRTALRPGRRDLLWQAGKAGARLIRSRAGEVGEGLPAQYAAIEFGGMAWGLGSIGREMLSQRSPAPSRG